MNRIEVRRLQKHRLSNMVNETLTEDIGISKRMFKNYQTW